MATGDRIIELTAGAAAALAAEVMEATPALDAIDTENIIRDRMADYLAIVLHRAVLDSLFTIRTGLRDSAS